MTVKIVIVYKRIEIVYITFKVVEGKMECGKSNNSPKGRHEEEKIQAGHIAQILEVSTKRLLNY